MTWEDVKSAPKTGSAILVWVPSNKCTYCVSWRDARHGDPACWLVFGGGWRDHIQGATHWMPLPTPPTEQE
jgi:hypothetical protein